MASPQAKTSKCHNLKANKPKEVGSLLLPGLSIMTKKNKYRNDSAP